MTRRAVLLLVPTLLLLAQRPDPWTPSEILQPAEFAAMLRASSRKPVILSVGFPVLYKSTRIPGAVFAGPGAKDAGLDELKKVVAKLPKDREIVVYCGCCPMDHCPNVRPAFQALKEMGYTKVKLLLLPTNLRTDWVAKGYPTEKTAGMQGF